jgi:hypothetical protein
MNIDLYKNTHVIKLNDNDFEFGKELKLTNKNFKNKDGYIMVYAGWCPNCQNKQPFWTLMAEKFNHDPLFAKENFRIGVISTTDPNAQEIVQRLNVTYIPRFLHVTPDADGNGLLSDFDGDHTPESLLSAVCDQKKKLCNIKFD